MPCDRSASCEKKQALRPKRPEKRLLWGVIWGMTVMMRMTPPRLALPMHSHASPRSNRTDSRGVCGRSSSNQGRMPTLDLSQKFQVDSPRTAVYLSRMVGRLRIVSLAPQLPPVRFRHATSPATVYLPPSGRSLAIAPHSL